MNDPHWRLLPYPAPLACSEASEELTAAPLSPITPVRTRQFRELAILASKGRRRWAHIPEPAI
jgi:hypothetical protein